MEFLIEILLRSCIETVFGWLFVMLPGGSIRWLISGRKRRWKEFQSADESFDNFRAVVLFVLVAGIIVGITYYLKNLL